MTWPDLPILVPTYLDFQVFGSRSSIDYDVMVRVSHIGNTAESHARIKEINAELKNFFPHNGGDGRKVNANLCVVKDGLITEVFKGTPDECNNSLYFTYGNHKQYRNDGPLVTGLYDRSLQEYRHLKLKRCYRFILSFYSRTYMREEVKAALRGNFALRLGVLQSINFNNPVFRVFPGKKDDPIDTYKVIAFQLAQTLALFGNFEVFTKEDAEKAYPDLGPYLWRKPVSDHCVLNKYLRLLLNLGAQEMYLMKSLEE
jgi:hypothetical protein